MPPKKIKNQELAKLFSQLREYNEYLIYNEEWENFYIYEKGYYKELPRKKLCKLIHKFAIKEHPTLQITAPLVKDIYIQLQWLCYRQYDTVISPYIALNDKLLNTDTFELEDHDMDKIAIHRISISSDQLTQPTPTFNQFLNTTIVQAKDYSTPDLDTQALVQQMFGFYLTNNLKAQAVFFLVGQGANGKSVMINVIQNIIGLPFTSALSLQSLTTSPYATASLIGKKINVCNEDESKYIRSDKFKALISGDLVQAERKFEASFPFASQTKFLLASNLTPTFDGLNVGLKRRIKIIPFHKIFKDSQQDKDLTDKLLEELGGIVGWAIKGAKQLKENNYTFTQTKATKKAMLEFEEGISSAIKFFRQSYQLSENGFVTHQNLYQTYFEWCKENSRKAMNSSNFRKDLRNHIEGFSELERYMRMDGKTMRGVNIEPLVINDGDIEFELVSTPNKTESMTDLLDNQLP